HDEPCRHRASSTREMKGAELIDPDDDRTWPNATRRWAEERARALEGSTAFVEDLEITLQEEDKFRETFGAQRVLAYHCTRLLTHEVAAIRAIGLRPLSESLVRDRIAAAVAHGALAPAVRELAERG